MKKNIKTKILTRLHNKFVKDLSDYKELNAPDNLIIHYKNKLDKEKYGEILINCLSIFQKNIFFKYIHIKDNSILFLMNMNFKNLQYNLKKVEEFADKLKKHESLQKVSESNPKKRVLNPL
ncbi:MAG: hypothetical protein ACLFN8_03250 [Candidatus Woesearchaeota archaeon]